MRTHPKLFRCQSDDCSALTDLALRMKGSVGRKVYDGVIHLCDEHLDLLADKVWLLGAVGVSGLEVVK